MRDGLEQIYQLAKKREPQVILGPKPVAAVLARSVNKRMLKPLHDLVLDIACLDCRRTAASLAQFLGNLARTRTVGCSTMFRQFFEEFQKDEQGIALGEGPPFPFSLDSESSFKERCDTRLGFWRLSGIIDRRNEGFSLDHEKA